MSDRISRPEYDANVTSSALEVIEQGREAILEEEGTMLQDEPSIQAILDTIYDHQIDARSIEGDEWIIYKYRNQQVIDCSRNEDAYLDLYGPEDLGRLIRREGLEGVIRQQAFYAMLADLNDEIAKQVRTIQK